MRRQEIIRPRSAITPEEIEAAKRAMRRLLDSGEVVIIPAVQTRKISTQAEIREQREQEARKRAEERGVPYRKRTWKPKLPGAEKRTAEERKAYQKERSLELRLLNQCKQCRAPAELTYCDECRARIKEWTARRIAEGKCARCSEIAIPGIKTCVKHREMQKIANKMAWEIRKARKALTIAAQ